MAINDPIDHALRNIELLIRLGNWESAGQQCRSLLQSNPEAAAGWACLGLVGLATQDFALAAEHFQKAVELNPANADAWHHRALALLALHECEEAERSSLRAVTLQPNHASFWLSRGNILFAQERFDDASRAYQESVSLDALNPVAWNCYGASQQVAGRNVEAKGAYEASLCLNPKQPETLVKLAYLEMKEWSLIKAVKLIQQTLDLEPRNVDAQMLLGRLQFALADPGPAVEIFRQLAEAQPSVSSESRFIHSLHYAPGITPEHLLEAHRRWNERYVGGSRTATATRRRGITADGRLHIGFISRDFGCSPIGYLALPLLQHIDKSRCSVTCYMDHRGQDEITLRFKAASDRWRTTYGIPHEQLAEQIASDEVDVLMDLMGHTGDRLPVFARRPAPVQITWLGYVGTTGMQAMDYLLADRFHVCSGEEQHYSEAILRMPRDYACYSPPDAAPLVGSMPALISRYLTFGCFNNPAKYSPAALDAWCEVLNRIPRSRLLMKFGGMHVPAFQDRLRFEFARRGVDAQRILFEGWSGHSDLLASYGRVDLALDTQPYSGGLTTCEALWMGVPVITWPGKTFAGRHSVSHLTNAGYPQFIAADREGYVELAVEWANRLDELAVIRANMREQVRQSPLCDAPQFAQDFLEVIRRAWEGSRPPKGGPRTATDRAAP